MMAQKETMMAEARAADQRLDTLLGAMNTASATPKTDATTAVVHEMVLRRRTMRDGMINWMPT